MTDMKYKLKDFRIEAPVVYGLMDSVSEAIVYVGKTTNAGKRMESYRFPKSCHNKKLSEWLISTGENVRVVALEVAPPDIDEAERIHIERFNGSLFNLYQGGKSGWMKYVAKPWMAGVGIKCPSDLMLLSLMNRKYPVAKEVKVIRSRMSDLERVLFEISICKDYMYLHKERFDRWLDRTEERLLSVLESPDNREVTENGSV